MEVGQIIKSARLEKGLTQEELGKLVGVQKSAIAKYENGRVVNIKRSTLKKLAAALDLKGSDLIEEKEKPTDVDSGLSPERKMLLDFVRDIPDDKAGMILRVMQTILADEK